MQSPARHIEAQVRVIQHSPESFRRAMGLSGARLALGAARRPGRITTNYQYSQTGKPMGLGGASDVMPNGSTGRGHPTTCAESGCPTYSDPKLPPKDQNNCPGGWNGCGDTVGVNATIAAGGTNVEVQISAPIEFTPRFFIYTGGAGLFLIEGVVVANGPDSTFGAGYSADVYRFDSFTSKAVSWPTFFNSPPLSVFVTNTDAMAAQDFTGVLQGVAAHQ